MHISITGGLGFIGFSLGSALSEDGHDVLLSDVRNHTVTPGMGYFNGSVLNQDDCRTVCEGMDVVVHCAAIHDANAISINPLSSIEINVSGTLNLLQAAIAAGAKRFVYISSAKVFGRPKNLPSTEADFPIPRETYALSKMTSEYYCHVLHEQSDIEIVIIRPYSVYGPGQELGSGYIGMILSSLLNRSELRLPGQPDFIRDFVHIDDVTRLCAAAATKDLPGITTLNAGSGQQTTLRELLELASKVSGIKLENRYHPPGPETLICMQACMKQAESLLGYRPEYDLRQGLSDTIQWFMHNRSQTEKTISQ